MSKHLVVVESPAKAKTIKKYLGSDFEVLASFGHVRDLLPKEGAVEPEQDFTMHYQLIEKNSKHVEAINKAMQRADALLLATDPDREGEAISWHLYEILKDKKTLNSKPVHRIVFHEITQRAVEDALHHPRPLSMDLVNAQQARRALDYLVGFNLSPLLWKKIRYGLSAGRVQSPALRLIVEREQAIEQFKSQEYWTINAQCTHARQTFTAKLTYFDNQKLTQFSIEHAEQAQQMKAVLEQNAQGQLKVAQIEKKQRRRQPPAPFTTSTVQQEAAQQLGFTTKRTMQIAQQLYEGIDTGSGNVGLITYMRTDSVHLAEEALTEIRQVIQTRYGAERLPAKPRHYKTKAKNAQEAHEAIRPTSAERTPEEIGHFLTVDQRKLYTLIWQRTLACQMIHATLDTVAVDLACGQNHQFRATGSTVVNPGFMVIYQEGVDDKTHSDDEKMLPALVKDQWVKLKTIETQQHFTEPPPRFSEATLVKTLEEFGIGRPSTYASIISTLLQREYVVLDKKRFIPTDVGRIVNKLLTEHFSRYVDYDFTAKLEDELDAISRGEQQWVPVMQRFWRQFKQLVDDKMQTVRKEDITQEALEEHCPQCGQLLCIRLGKRGRFIGCSGYPNCDYTRNLDDDNPLNTAVATPEVVADKMCPQCGSALHIKQGRYSKFIGCSQYPKCKYKESLEKPLDTGISCPQCQQGSLIRKKSRYGSFFYSCSTYPACKYAIAHEPIAETCPKCHWPILMLKTTKRRGNEKVCPQKQCDYSEAVAADTITSAYDH